MVWLSYKSKSEILLVTVAMYVRGLYTRQKRSASTRAQRKWASKVKPSDLWTTELIFVFFCPEYWDCRFIASPRMCECVAVCAVGCITSHHTIIHSSSFELIQVLRRLNSVQFIDSFVRLSFFHEHFLLISYTSDFIHLINFILFIVLYNSWSFRAIYTVHAHQGIRWGCDAMGKIGENAPLLRIVRASIYRTIYSQSISFVL